MRMGGNLRLTCRIWRREGTKVPKKQPKRDRRWLNDGSGISDKVDQQGPRLDRKLASGAGEGGKVQGAAIDDGNVRWHMDLSWWLEHPTFSTLHAGELTVR